MIGSGNVGWHLGHRMQSCGVEILQVYSRQLPKAQKLGKALGVEYTSDLAKVNQGAEIYLLAVHDDAILDVANQLQNAGLKGKLLAHTSGATPLTVFNQLPSSANRSGVFWPLQTFTLDRIPDFTKIPVCIDANEKTGLAQLGKLAKIVSSNVHCVNDEQRAALHLAAVFVNNFTNHLFHLGKSILAEKQLPFELLLPLIQETVDKIYSNDPGNLQTGPAIRGDEATISRHRQILASYPGLEKVYSAITESIQHSYKK